MNLKLMRQKIFFTIPMREDKAGQRTAAYSVMVAAIIILN